MMRPPSRCAPTHPVLPTAYLLPTTIYHPPTTIHHPPRTTHHPPPTTYTVEVRLSHGASGGGPIQLDKGEASITLRSEVAGRVLISAGEVKGLPAARKMDTSRQAILSTISRAIVSRAKVSRAIVSRAIVSRTKV